MGVIHRNLFLYFSPFRSTVKESVSIICINFSRSGNFSRYPDYVDCKAICSYYTKIYHFGIILSFFSWNSSSRIEFTKNQLLNHKKVHVFTVLLWIKFLLKWCLLNKLNFFLFNWYLCVGQIIISKAKDYPVKFDPNTTVYRHDFIGHVLVNNGQDLIFNFARSKEVYRWRFMDGSEFNRAPSLDTLFLHDLGVSASANERHIWACGSGHNKVEMLYQVKNIKENAFNYGQMFSAHFKILESFKLT